MGPVSLEEATHRLASFVRSSLGTPDLADEDDIFVKGDASSLFSMELVLFIEKELGVPLDDEDLEQTNFSSIMDLATLLESKLRP
jgi:acyl carrier protein